MPPAPRGGLFRQQQPPGPKELRPALQHGGGSRRASVGPALTAVTGAAAPPRLGESNETPARCTARRAALCPRSPEPGVSGSIYPRLFVEHPRSAGTSLRWEARGRCRQGEGRRQKTCGKEANFQAVPQPLAKR